MKRFKFQYWWLGLIVVVCLGLRLINIESNPPAMYGDEVTMVYDAYSIGQTGRAQTGEWFPFTFTLGDHRPPGYVYATVPLTMIFGPTALAARLPSVLAGVGLTILFFLLGRRLFSFKIGLLSAAIVAVLPWDISISRAAFESHLALFWLVFGIYAFLKGSDRGWWYVVSAITFGLAFNTYSTYKLYVPVVVGLLILVQGIKKPSLKKLSRSVLVAIAIGLIWIGIFGYQAVNGSEERLSRVVGIQSEELAMAAEVNNQRRLAGQIPGSELFHNRGIEYGWNYLTSYLALFSPEFLLISGDQNPRHNVFEGGAILLAEAILIILGGLYLWWKKRRWFWFFGGLLMLSPIPTMITQQVHYLRSSLMIVPLVFLAAVGFGYLTDPGRWQFWRRSLAVLIGLAMFVQLVFMIEWMLIIYPQMSQQFWSVSAKEASLIAQDQAANYDLIIISDRIDNVEFGYPAYARVKPELVIDQHQNRTLLNGQGFKKFDNILIGSINPGEIEQFVSGLPGKVLYLGPGTDSAILPGEIIENIDRQPMLLKYERVP